MFNTILKAYYLILLFKGTITAKLGTEGTGIQGTCNCIALGLCPISAIEENVQCDIRSHVCCSEVPPDFLTPPEDNPVVNSDQDISTNPCICMPSENCIDLRSGSFSVATRSQTCANPQNICCSLEVTDDELLTGIFGNAGVVSNESNPVEPHIPDGTKETSACICVPKEQCKVTQEEDLLSLVNLRSGVANTCETKSFVCCEEVNIITPPEIIPLSIGECECVPKEQCQARPVETDLSSIVHLRTQPNAKCHEESLICCAKNDIIPVPAAIQNCHCVPKEDCQQSFLETDLSSIVHVRTGSSQTCDNANFICCPPAYIKTPSLPIGPDPQVPLSCTCVATDMCSSSLTRSTSVCSDPSAICCPNIDIISSITVDEEPPPIRCRCVARSMCKQLSVIPGSLGCPNSEDICCSLDSIRSDTEPGASGECTCVSSSSCSAKNIVNSPCSLPTDVCCVNPKLSCGQSHESNSRIDVRIRGGFYANFAEFPWMATILEQQDTGKDEYKCGGSLIHPQVVLTAAHCIDNDTGLIMKIRAGDWDIESTSEKIPHQERFVTQRIFHPKYSRRSLQYDIGLLTLDSPIKLDYHINTICLPSLEPPLHHPACLASGWGKDDFGEQGQYQTTLKKIHVPYMTNKECQAALRKTRLGPGFSLSSTFVCAGGVRDDTCTGDGGSPLVCPLEDGSNRYVQIGAVAWGIECGNPNVPGVYASVQSAVPWIRDYMTKEFGPESLQYFS